MACEGRPCDQCLLISKQSVFVFWVLGSKPPNTGQYVLLYDGDGDGDEEEGADGVYDVDSEQTSAKR